MAVPDNLAKASDEVATTRKAATTKQERPDMHPKKRARVGRAPKTLILALGVAAPSLLAGCGGGGSGSGTHMASSASAETPFGLTATLTQDKNTVARGGTVTYTLTLTNNTSQAIAYEEFQGCGYVGRENAYLRITDAAGETDYPDQNGNCSPVRTPSASLAPGASVSDTFAPPASAFAAGHYTVTGSFDTFSGDEVFQTNAGPLTVDVT